MKKNGKKTELPANHSRANTVKKFNWKLAGQLAVSFVITATIYMVFVSLQIAFIVHIYAAALFLLLVTYVLLARGFSCRPFNESLFPENWDSEKRAKYLKSDIKRKRIAKKLLLFIIPIILTFMFDMIIINFF